MERKLSEQELVRREKLKSIERPYPDKYETTHTISEARNLPDGTKNVSIAGRIGFMRKMGKLAFVKIRNIEDAIQLQFRADVLGDEKYEEMKKIFDSGDFIGAKGEIITTQTGEKSLEVEDFTFLGKALRPLPEKFHGLQDAEIKYRERYVDLITNQDSRDLFLGRSKFYYFLRNFMHDNGFLEVETPIVQTAVSGASAKPFFTHHNALNIDCNVCGKGLKIMHLGPILTNGRAHIGENVKLHVNTHIVAGGSNDDVPIIGNNVVIGVGAVVLGRSIIADGIAIGANAVVNKSFQQPNITIAGVPAKKISDKGRDSWGK